MLKEYIDVCVESCLEELQNSKNKRIKKAMKEIEKEMPNALQEEGLKAVSADIIRIILNDGIEDEKDECDLILEVLRGFTAELVKMKTLYTFKVSLKGLEEEIHRTIRVSSGMKLAELGYVILAAVQGDGSHFFNFVIRKQSYVCDSELEFDEIEPVADLASLYSLAELDLKKNTKIDFNYDYGDNFSFNVSLQEISVDEDYVPKTTNLVLDGNGSGIWEDEHFLMELYYKDKKNFNEFLKENGLEEDEYPIACEFDLEECNEAVRGNLFPLKLSYEGDDDDLFGLDEYDDFDKNDRRFLM